MKKPAPKPYIKDLQEQHLKDNIRIYPCHSNRASECGHPCTRYLTYCRTHWDKRTPHNHTVQAIFELGKELEKVVVQGWLQDRLGLEIVAPKHTTFSYPSVQLTGHLDCYIEEEVEEDEESGDVRYRPANHASEPDPHSRATSKRVWVPVEVKGIARNTWREVNSFNDLLKSKRSWVRKWAGQLLVYMLMDNKPYGRFVFFSKETGEMKDVPVVLEDHLDLAEEILKRLEAVNKHVENGTLPDRFYEPGTPDRICEDCGFSHICLPGGSYHSALALVDDDEIEKAIDKYFEDAEAVQVAKQIANENDELRKQLRDMLNGKENCIIGKYHVTGKMRGGKNPYWMWDARKIASEEENK